MGPEDYHNNEDHFEGKDYGQNELDAMFETLLHPPNLISAIQITWMSLQHGQEQERLKISMK